MPEPQINVLVLDPYHPVLGMLAPFVFQRMKDCAEVYLTEMSPEAYVREVAVRFYGRDPRVKIVAMIDPKGIVVGHGIATLETDGINTWCFVSQVKADGNVGNAVHVALDIARAWAVTAGCAKIVMATGRSERAWEKAYGFKVDRRIMSLDLEQKG